MSREQFRRLRRGQRLQERRGRIWTVHVPPFGQEGLEQVILRAGDLSRQLNERFADDYMLLPG
jgi:hypothetical protein